MTSRDELVDQVNRLVDQLRAMSLARLERTSVGLPSVAQSAHAFAQVLADLAADVRGVAHRDVPRLATLASGDLVAVTANDLLSVTQHFDDSFSLDPVVAPEGIESAPAHVAIDVALAAVKSVRSQI